MSDEQCETLTARWVAVTGIGGTVRVEQRWVLAPTTEAEPAVAARPAGAARTAEAAVHTASTASTASHAA